MSATHAVRLEWRSGRRETLRIPEDETVLDAAEAAGLALPFGCRTGACATCTGKLRAGDVEHRRPPRALKERHLDDGYVLPCIAEPRSRCRIEVGTDVASDLLSNPFR